MTPKVPQESPQRLQIPPKTLSKPFQNASKNEVPKNIEFFEVFYYSFGMFAIFETLKILIFP